MSPPSKKAMLEIGMSKCIAFICLMYSRKTMQKHFSIFIIKDGAKNSKARNGLSVNFKMRNVESREYIEALCA